MKKRIKKDGTESMILDGKGKVTQRAGTKFITAAFVFANYQDYKKTWQGELVGVFKIKSSESLWILFFKKRICLYGDEKAIKKYQRKNNWDKA